MDSKSFYKAFSLILAVVFFVLMITVFVYGLKLNFVDNKKSTIPFGESGSFLVFVGGAVENEKFYEVRYSTTYGELFLEAGAFENSSLKILDYHETVNPFDSKIISKAVNWNEFYIICNYADLSYADFKNKNINYASIDDLKECGIEEEKAVNIRHYIDNNGYIKDKYELAEKGLLTLEEFDAVKYKIYAYIVY